MHNASPPPIVRQGERGSSGASLPQVHAKAIWEHVPRTSPSRDGGHNGRPWIRTNEKSKRLRKEEIFESHQTRAAP